MHKKYKRELKRKRERNIIKKLGDVSHSLRKKAIRRRVVNSIKRAKECAAFKLEKIKENK